MIDLVEQETMIILMVVILFLLLRYFSKGNWNKPLVLTEGLEDGKRMPVDERNLLLGKTGIAVTDLDPSGIAEIGSWRGQVLGDIPYIAKGTTIKVYQVEGSTVLVTTAKVIRDEPYVEK